MNPGARQKILAGVLAVVLVALALRFVPGWLADGDGGGTWLGRSAAPAPSAAERIEVATLDLRALTAEPRDYEPGRNPFDYYQPPPPVPPKPPGPTPEELARRAEEERRRQEELERQREENPPPPPKPTPPAFQLTYLGSFGPEERRIAVFTDGEQIYNALVGDVLEEKFVVSDIGFESVSITYVGFPEEPARRVAIGG